MLFNHSSGYDMLTRHAILYLVVAMTCIHVMHIFTCIVVDIMTGARPNLYVLLVR
jgi:hypothetical protein